MSDVAGTEPPRPRLAPAKGPAAFRTISEASVEVGVPQHVLRFWETRFAFIRPTKRAGGRRFYRPQDLEVLRGVRTLLQDEGYTIKGVQKLHREQGLKRLLAASGVGEAAASRLAADVEPSDVTTGAPAPQQASPPSDAPSPEADDEADDGPQTGDLFDEPSFPPVAAAASAPPAEPRPPPARSVLDAGARERLGEVLDDLEGAKARIDALLRG